MDSDSIRRSAAACNALGAAFRAHGMRLLPDADLKVMSILGGKGVTVAVSDAGFLELKQGDTLMVLSSALESLRRESPTLFASDVRFDQIASKEDFHGSTQEIAQAKTEWISKHGTAAWEALPATRQQAELRSVAPSASITRQQFSALSISEKAELSGLIGPDGVSKIMARTK